MAVILCIETATTNCSVAIFKDSRLLAVREENDKNYSHAEKLHVFIDEVIEESGVLLSDLSAIAVSKGPGSYTGLRIGVSAAKGFSFGLDIPLISVLTLKSMAQQVADNDGIVIPMLDARRMEVYAAAYDIDGNQILPATAIILDEHSFSDFLNHQKVYFIGNGIDKFQQISTSPNAVFINEKFPSAIQMGQIAMEKFSKSEFEDVAYFEPFYLKDFLPG